MPTEQMEAQRQAIKQVVRTGTMGDGSPVEETYDYWNRLAEIWDDLYPEDLNPSATVLSLVPETDEPLRVVDVGCGTGKAWETVFERATNARITGIELCPAMLEKVRQRFRGKLDQLSLIEGSSLDTPMGDDYDVVISMLHVHFFSTEQKAKLFKKMYLCLRPGGLYLGRDLCTSRRLEQDSVEFYREYVSPMPGADRGAYNYKQSMSVATHHRLLHEAGFVDIEPFRVSRESLGVGIQETVARRPA